MTLAPLMLALLAATQLASAASNRTIGDLWKLGRDLYFLGHDLARNASYSTAQTWALCLSACRAEDSCRSVVFSYVEGEAAGQCALADSYIEKGIVPASLSAVTQVPFARMYVGGASKYSATGNIVETYNGRAARNVTLRTSVVRPETASYAFVISTVSWRNVNSTFALTKTSYYACRDHCVRIRGARSFEFSTNIYGMHDLQQCFCYDAPLGRPVNRFLSIGRTTDFLASLPQRDDSAANSRIKAANIVRDNVYLELSASC